MEVKSDSPVVMQESWVQVSEVKSDVPRMRSTGEVTQLLADAATEESMLMSRQEQLQQHFQETIPQDNIEKEEMTGNRGLNLKDIYSRLLKKLQDVFQYLTNPVVLATHLAAFGFGFYIGRRMFIS